ncbi:hypothetical protein AVEN_188349-1 [Araneus ventricosus]|uniref:HTH psq-type domain-containing protein n=1 Tax=Araneus ventricosus TaxID=182803 RepID=A0A4Y2W972_ARAVE|nr:hypothetical protein AVEN_188349-1 [Araneus ventricosus]
MPKSALSSTVASGTKRKHVTLSIKDKVNLIKKLESGTAVAKLCEEYWTRTSTSSQEDKKLPKMTPLKYCIVTIKPRQCVSPPMPKYAVWC